MADVLTTTFLLGILAAGIRLATPVLLAVIGEIISEKGGVLNLGLEGLMLMGAMAGFAVTFALQHGPLAGYPLTAAWLGLAAGAAAGMLLGLVLAVLAISLRADQVVSSVMLVLLGSGLSSYLFRLYFAQMAPHIVGFESHPLPYLAAIPLLGPLLFAQNATVYLTIGMVIGAWFLLNRTTLGLTIRAAGEIPSAVETAGLSVIRTRYTATLIGAALAGLGGAVLTVGQLHIFRENITAGRGWIAVALVIFARWKPWLAVVGALLFGLADAVQYRIQALGITAIPYEALLALPYLLTIVVLLRGIRTSERPAALGTPYKPGER